MDHPTGALRADHQLLAAVRSWAHLPHVASAARALSRGAEHGAMWIAFGLAGSAADRGRRGRWLRATALVAGAHTVGMAAKRVIRRPRPVLAAGQTPLVHTAGRHSFPSCHAVSSVAAAVAFGPLVPAAPLGRLAAAVCLSRLIVGVHYPSDVAAGAALGAGLARLGGPWMDGAAHG